MTFFIRAFQNHGANDDHFQESLRILVGFKTFYSIFKKCRIFGLYGQVRALQYVEVLAVLIQEPLIFEALIPVLKVAADVQWEIQGDEDVDVLRRAGSTTRTCLYHFS